MPINLHLFINILTLGAKLIPVKESVSPPEEHSNAVSTGTVKHLPIPFENVEFVIEIVVGFLLVN